MRDETIDVFLGKLAQRTAAPAGGATAALNAAQAAALLAMTARFCDGPRHAGNAETVETIIGDAERLRDKCTALVAADGAAYGPVMAAYALPRDTEELKAARSAAIAEAMVTAAVPPSEVIAAGARLLELAELLQPIVNRSIAADVAAAVESARAAIGTSRTNVEANLSGVTDAAARDQLTQVVADVDALEARAVKVIAALRAVYVRAHEAHERPST